MKAIVAQTDNMSSTIDISHVFDSMEDAREVLTVAYNNILHGFGSEEIASKLKTPNYYSITTKDGAYYHGQVTRLRRE